MSLLSSSTLYDSLDESCKVSHWNWEINVQITKNVKNLQFSLKLNNIQNAEQAIGKDAKYDQIYWEQVQQKSEFFSSQCLQKTI